MKEFSPEEHRAATAVANEAVKRVKSGMIIGLGTGRAAAIFIETLLKRLKNNPMKLSCVPTSLKSKDLIAGKIPTIDESLPQTIDITFDGADRVDTTNFFLIKGGGGALLREKLVAKRSKENIVLVDASKIVHPLSNFPLPIEIVPFAYKATIERVEALGYQGTLRINEGHTTPALSDNGHFIFDIDLKAPIENAWKTHTELKQILGVIETGLFLDTATTIYVGNPKGEVTIVEKS